MDEPKTIGKVQRRGLAQEAANRIREAIFNGLFAQGAPLREVELATALEISRGSVREGLSALEREGLVRSEWHRGAHVIELTPDDIDEVYAVRAALERLASCTAATRASADDLDALDRQVTNMIKEIEAGSDNVRLLSLDIGFHDMIYRIAGNRRLADAWQAVRSQVYLVQLSRIRLGDVDYRARIVQEHRELAMLLRAGDTNTLAQIAEDHVHSARHALLTHLAHDEPKDKPART